MVLRPRKAEPMRSSPKTRGIAVFVPERFFRRRGALDLTRDASRHRRYSYLYEDTLE